ncbi:MAG: diacylglycerol kinase family lipid kinase [Myxococcota bacterium]|nr:diacylglycerol kinase family lipid kinase [Myxococcota bacterium]
MSDDRSFLLVVNPRAGAGRAAARLADLQGALREAGAIFETALTRAPGEATALVRAALRRGVSGIAAVGGDGTFNEVVNGFFDDEGRPIRPEAWFGPLPCGTGGDLRRTLGLPAETAAMATRLVWSQPRPIDVGWLEFRDAAGSTARRAFVNIASFGVSGLVDRLVNEGPKWIGGRAAFLFATVRALASYRPRRVRLRLDDAEAFERVVVTVAIANGRYFGAGMHIAPEARIDDALFDVVSIEPTTRRDQLRAFPALYGRGILDRPGVRLERARRVLAEPADFEGPIWLDVDGETPGSLPASFELRPAALLLRA